MSELHTTVTSLIAGGIGAGVGAIGAAAITTIGRKSEARAAAADLIVRTAVESATGLLKPLRERVRELEAENRRLCVTVTAAIDLIDDTLPMVTDPLLAKQLRVVQARMRGPA